MYCSSRCPIASCYDRETEGTAVVPLHSIINFGNVFSYRCDSILANPSVSLRYLSRAGGIETDARPYSAQLPEGCVVGVNRRRIVRSWEA